VKYVLAIYTDEAYWPALDEAAQQEEIDAYWSVDREAQAAGVFVASEPLAPSSETRTVRVRDDEPLVTDGPFAETKEQLGGFYLLDCADADEAVEWAKRIPGARRGYVEVRPVVEFEPPDDLAAGEGA
jgi:hypothetical protein